MTTSFPATPAQRNLWLGWLKHQLYFPDLPTKLTVKKRSGKVREQYKTSLPKGLFDTDE